MQMMLIPLFAFAGLAFGVLLWLFFRRMPVSWLLDYDQTEPAPELLVKKQLRLLPDALLLVVADALVFALGWLLVGPSLQLPVILLAAQPLLLIMVADFKTRIIPDQFILALIPCSILLWLADGLAGEPALPAGLLYRLLAGLAAGGLLFVSGWLGEKILHREAMGMGDVKLLAACGLLIGLQRLPMLLILSFLSAACVAVPLLIRRMRRPESGSDMAFGPYIALAALLTLLLGDQLVRLWELYLGLLI